MQELVINLHMHTTYSDGSGSHQDIANAAMQAELDAVITTDHNVFVHGPEAYYRKDKRRVLVLVGEEVHNQARIPQKSHLLIFGAGREMAGYAEDPQALIDNVRKAGGISFIAHPYEYAAPAIGEEAIDWDDWYVQSYNGLELWNGMGEIKSIIPTKLHAIFYAFFPKLIAHAPYPQTLKKWDELLASGQRVYGVGGSDAHALKLGLGPIKKTVFPYEFHFSVINTHIQVPTAPTGDVNQDKKLVLDALKAGHAFVGYDLPASTRGFNFTAKGKDKTAWIGDEISHEGGVTIQIHLPGRAECHLLKDGQVIKTWNQQENCVHITTEPGIYRVEVLRNYLGKKRGWIYSNPIFVI